VKPEAACADYQIQVTGYLDGELPAPAKSQLENHLASCETCRQYWLQEKVILERLRHHPRIAASTDLRSGIEARFSIAAPMATMLRSRIFIPASALILLVAIGIASWAMHDARADRTSQFTKLAVETHLRRVNHQLPLEVISSSPEIVSNWFSGKINFHLELPRHPKDSLYTEKYALEGARLVDFNGEYGAGVSYRMEDQLITLVVFPSTAVMPGGGDRVVSGKLIFHLQDQKGFHVITWADHGLTYALVSNLEERGQQSCMVCHHQNSEPRLSLLSR
jgi:anti-sigma factor RsiW